MVESTEPQSPSEITVADLLRTTGQIVTSRGVTCTLIAAMCTLPSTLISNAAKQLADAGADGPLGMISMAAYVAGIALAQSSLARVALDHLRGRAGSGTMDALGAGFVQLVPVALIAFLSTIATVLGLMLAVVPGVLVWLAFFVALPAAVAEHVGPIRAIRRSIALTKGHRGALFAASTVIALCWLPFICCGGVPRASYTLFVLDHAAHEQLPVWIRVLTIAINLTGQAFLLIVLSTLSAVTYARIRALHARIDVAAIADEFA